MLNLKLYPESDFLCVLVMEWEREGEWEKKDVCVCLHNAIKMQILCCWTVCINRSCLLFVEWFCVYAARLGAMHSLHMKLARHYQIDLSKIQCAENEYLRHFVLWNGDAENIDSLYLSLARSLFLSRFCIKALIKYGWEQMSVCFEFILEIIQFSTYAIARTVTKILQAHTLMQMQNAHTNTPGTVSRLFLTNKQVE